jgi:formamidopyrimidine-DNA glycosylase
MPELPEVETVSRGLGNILPGRKILTISSDWPKSFPNSDTDVKKFLINGEISTVRRRGKVLLIELITGYTLVTHLKMTGQLVFRGEQNFGAGHPNDSLIGKLPDKSTRVVIDFVDGSKLFFNDQRKFGWMRLFPTSEVDNIDFFRKLGPEPLTHEFTSLILKQRLMKRPGSSIKAVLLDQSILAGIGNIYADESLWTARIHPKTLVKKLTTKNINDLHEAIVSVLKLSIEKGGSTDRNYVDALGRKGSYLSFANVFRREGMNCPRCGTVIIKIRVAGRGTHVCANCQKEKS